MMPLSGTENVKITLDYKKLANRLLRGFLTICALAAMTIAEAVTIPLDSIVAIADEDVILQSELDERVELISTQIESRQTPLPDMDTLKEQVLERLLVESLQLQMAENAGVRISDDELNQTMNTIAAQNGLNLQQFQAALENDGVSYAASRAQIRNEMLMSTVQRNIMRSRIQITDQEIMNFLDSELGETVTADEFRVAHILLAMDADASADEIRSVRQQAEGLLTQLAEGADFQQLAVSHSSGQRALEGGDLGWRKPAELPSLFADIVQQMETGEVTDPIKTSSGFHLIKLLQKRGAKAEGNVEQTQLRHILIQTSEIRTDREARELAMEIRDEMLAGRDFEELAKLYSEDPGSALSGGALGWNRSDTFETEFEKVMDNLAIDEVSEVFKTIHGYHFLQVTGRRVEDFSEEFRKSQAEYYLRNSKFDEELDNWLRELREEAFVDIRL